MSTRTPAVAVIIPAWNEASTIAKVVTDFREALPGARLSVYDNNSSDPTARAARAAGAEVRPEPRQGKGHVVRRALADIEADVYVLVDGDATYDAPSAPGMVELLLAQQLDMVVARRRLTGKGAYRPGHQFGNWLLTATVRRIFGSGLNDLLSGYRVFSRRFVKSFPTPSTGFEIETELSIHALALQLPVAEIDTPYFARPEGSHSKLGTWRDGVSILGTILRLFVFECPLRFFSLLALALVVAATVLFAPVLLEYLQTGLVPRLPTMLAAASVYTSAFLSIVVGAVLHTTALGRLEAKRLAYLAVSPAGYDSAAVGDFEAQSPALNRDVIQV